MIKGKLIKYNFFLLMLLIMYSYYVIFKSCVLSNVKYKINIFIIKGHIFGVQPSVDIMGVLELFSPKKIIILCKKISEIFFYILPFVLLIWDVFPVWGCHFLFVTSKICNKFLYKMHNMQYS
jgi:hypothetical protein